LSAFVPAGHKLRFQWTSTTTDAGHWSNPRARLWRVCSPHIGLPLTLFTSPVADRIAPGGAHSARDFRRKVRRSAYMRSASAVGLASVLRPGGGLREQFNQKLRIWREGDPRDHRLRPHLSRGCGCSAREPVSRASAFTIPAQRRTLPLSRVLEARRARPAAG